MSDKQPELKKPTVEGVLRAVARLDRQEMETREVPPPPNFPDPRPSWRLLLPVSLAAAALVGWLAARFLFPGNAGRDDDASPVGMVAASPRPLGHLGPAEDNISRDTQGIYHLKPGQRFSVDLRSDRSGVATIVLLAGKDSGVWPGPTESPLPLKAKEPGSYPGPLTPLKAEQTQVIVVVTENQAADTIRQVLKDGRGATVEELRSALSKAGHRWVTMDQFVLSVAPVK